MDGDDGDGDDRCKDGREHDDDEQGRAVGGLRRRLGDPHGVDKGVRDELDELHISFDGGQGTIVAEIPHDASFPPIAESKGQRVHL